MTRWRLVSSVRLWQSFTSRYRVILSVTALHARINTSNTAFTKHPNLILPIPIPIPTARLHFILRIIRHDRKNKTTKKGQIYDNRFFSVHSKFSVEFAESGLKTQTRVSSSRLPFQVPVIVLVFSFAAGSGL